MKTLKFRFLPVLWNWNVCDMWGSNIFWIFIVGFQKRNFRVILWGADMREISTEEFRKLSADKKARTFPINTHTRPLSYTGRGWELDKSKTLRQLILTQGHSHTAWGENLTNQEDKIFANWYFSLHAHKVTLTKGGHLKTLKMHKVVGKGKNFTNLHFSFIQRAIHKRQL